MIVNSPSDCQPYRMSVRNALLAEVGHLQDRAAQLEALAKVVPEREEDWPPGAAAALWDLIITHRR